MVEFLILGRLHPLVLFELICSEHFSPAETRCNMLQADVYTL